MDPTGWETELGRPLGASTPLSKPALQRQAGSRLSAVLADPGLQQKEPPLPPRFQPSLGS